MSMTGVATAECPNCFSPMAEGATRCEACGYSLVQGPPVVEVREPKPKSIARVWSIVTACYWIVEIFGALIWLDVKRRSSGVDEGGPQMIGEFGSCIVACGLILVAVGVIQEWRWARMVALVLAWFGMIFGLGEIVFAVTGALSGNQDILTQIGVSALETAMSYMTIWSIRATEVH
jgi:hypothetical protein